MKTFDCNRVVHRPSRIAMLLMLLAAFSVTLSNRAWSYTPEDPIVQSMIKRGLAYLEKVDWDKFGLHREGQKMMVAYAHFKVEHDPNHPLVKEGIVEAKKFVKMATSDQPNKHFNYEAAVSVLLLASVDPKAYDADLRVLQEFLFDEQRANGPWTYRRQEQGDVSQTQYALLAIWTLDRVGVRLDYRKVAAAAQWLLRVQDPSGAWPYRGTDPGRGGLQPQEKPTYSMALAGGSSVLIAGDALRLWGDIAENDTGIAGLPKAVKVYRGDENVERRNRASISSAPILAACERMAKWRASTPYKRMPNHHFYYQLYTLERYESFIEIAYGDPEDKSPAWYNKGVDELRRAQSAEGGWTEKDESQPPVNTAFAILFLIRSTQKAIATMGEGTARGGKGFGKDVRNAKLVGGSVKTEPIATAVTDLLKILEEDDADSLADKSLPDDLQLAEKGAERAAQLDRFERLVRGSKSWQARRVAARLLGKSDEMRVVPALIYALSDPDESVKRFARDGLRFISRKFEGYGMPDKPSPAQMHEAQKNWRAWYLSVRPGFVFLDQ